MALTNKLTAIGDAIRAKTNTTEQMTLEQMATAINGITTGSGEGGYDVPDEALKVTGSCNYRFTFGWEWFIRDFGHRITTERIVNGQYMFSSSGVDTIPFYINMTPIDPTTVTGNNDTSYMFYMSKITKAPYVTGSIAKSQCMFKSCERLTEIPDDWAEKVDFHNLREYQYANASQMFDECKSLRRIPQNLLEALACVSTSTNAGSRTFYKSLISNCYVFDELLLPVQQMVITDDALSYTVSGCYRLKSFKFTTQEDGTPYTVNWKNQKLDFSSNVGSATSVNYITGYNSGITADKRVTDDATYQALKNDPDWFTTSTYYSRYNHDSAVETINSLPDTYAYLAANGGTNTIKFKRVAGELTDGGAINTLTEEEIAVATAKGWTVTFA